MSAPTDTKAPAAERLATCRAALATLERMGGRWLAPGVTVRAFELEDEIRELEAREATP